MNALPKEILELIREEKERHEASTCDDAETETAARQLSSGTYPLPSDTLERLRESNYRCAEVLHNLIYVRRERFESLVYRYIGDDDLYIDGHSELWRLCGKLWHDNGEISESLFSTMDLICGDERAPATYAQVAQFLCDGMKSIMPPVGGGPAFRVH